MSPLKLLERLAALVPAHGLHLIRFHDVLAPNARLRPDIIPNVSVNANTPSADHGEVPPRRLPHELCPAAQTSVRDRYATLLPVRWHLEVHQSLEEWLNTFGIQVKIEALNENNLRRAAQLLNKTNQMNLSTRRLSEEDFLDWSQQEGNKVWTFRVSDRFTDSGLTGIVSLESD
jgi:hypothetical protein